MIDGSLVKIGGKDYTLPNLNFKRLQQVVEYLPNFYITPEVINEKQMEAILKIATVSLQRNYDGITEDFIAENLEFYEIEGLVLAIGEQFKKNTIAAETEASPSTGTESTQS